MMWLRVHHVVAVCFLCSAIEAGLMPTAQAQTKPPAVLDNPVAVLSLEQLAATRERPLFSPSRHARPASVSIVRAPAPQPPAPPPAPPKIELQGTIINADEALAIVYSSANNQTTRLHIGDEISGWKVAVVEERKLVLSLEQRTAEFTMFTARQTDHASAGRTGPFSLRARPAPAPAGLRRQ
jgi:general secretion pathway protein N